ncbi:MAG: CPBP family intramembrane metalloprotease [Bacteroidales bacterium]|nr:CPBP family intramembrane metalloprotease [Bacteroidales bacterium]
MSKTVINRTKILSILEFIILFFGIPLVIFVDKNFIHPSIILLPVLMFIFLILRYTTDFRFRELFRWNIPKASLIKNSLIVLMFLLLMLGYILVFEKENLFNLPRANPWIFLAMCLLYPVFSAFGQEIIYRTFLSRRYKLLFRKEWQFVVASGTTFSFLHIVYYHPVSMILTFLGGIYLARVYWQTRSVLFTSVLHGLLGIIVFGVGLGQYFWLDMPVQK